MKNIFICLIYIKTISKLPSANVTHQDISGKVNTSDVKDNLTSTDTNKPLSAKQGKVLDEKISNIVSGNVDLSSNHQHDDRYYTESEIDTKLNGKANSSHTHPDTQITWNGTNTQNSVSPLDMAMYEEFSANRFAYFPGNNITIEYSTDGGSTWTTDTSASATEKLKLVTTSSNFRCGNNSTTNYAKNQLRVTIKLGETNANSIVYMDTRKLMLYLCTCGASGTKVQISTSTYKAPTTFTNQGNAMDVQGYSGWNSIPLAITLGGYAGDQTNTSSTRVQYLRLTFTQTGGTGNLNLQKIRIFGEKYWNAPSILARIGHLYSYDENQIATFPSNIVASKFIKNGVNNTNLLTANGGDVAQSTFATSGHTHSNYLTSHNPVDTTLSSTSTNAVQNKVINTALGNKVDKVSGKGLSTNDFTATYKTALDNLNTTIANAVSNLEMIEVVTSLPTSNIKTNKLYLKANSVNGSENKYDFYVRVNNAWEKVDSLDFSISDYIKKDSNTNLLLSNGTTKAQSSFIANSTGSVTSTHIADKTIVNGDIADATIESGKIKNGAVTNEKLSGTKITASSSSIVDLNDTTYQKTGFYYCDNDNYAPYIIHCPWSNGTTTPYTGNKSFFLFVEDWGTNTYSCKQTLTYYNGNNTYTRTKTNSTTWTAWKEHNTNNNDYLQLATRVISGEAIVANNIIGGSNDSKYYKLKSGLVLDTRYPILFNTSAITSGSYTDNVYSSHTGVPLTNNVSGKTVTNQKQVYIEGTSYDGKLFTVSDRVFVSDDQISSSTDLGKYYIYIGVSYSTTNIRFNSFHQTVYVETRNGLVPVGDNTHNPHMLVKGDAGTAGYFKFLTIRVTGTYHDQTIEFDTTHRGNKPKTVVSFNFNTYEKTSGSKQYYTNIQAFYYHGHPTPVYYIQTNDGVQDATFDFYIRRETWDEMGVSDLRSSTNNYNGMTVTWHNEFVTALPTGTTQATLNPYYAQVGHTHGSIANNGQLNSDITSVNKVAVTDSSNNLKTISQLPYSKISGTPTIPTKTSQLTNDSNFTTATGHTHSYLPLSGGDITGRVSLPIARDSTSNTDNSNIPWAGTNNLSWDTDMWTTLKNRKSLMGTFSDGSKWWNVISNRHRNGNGDGTSYGMYLRTTLQDDGHLLWAKQKGASSFMAERTILDSSNYSTYANKTTITNNLTTSTTGTALDASQGKWLKDNTVQTAGTGLTKSSNTLGIANGGVTATQLADKSVTDAKLANYEYINGTQTASTSAWTGVTTKLTSTTIPTGTIIYYRLNQSSTSTNVTLELKLSSDNTKTTGAKAVFLDDRRVTTHFRLGSIIPLRYDGTNWIVISPYTDNNTDTHNAIEQGTRINVGEAVSANTIVGKVYGDSNGYYKKLVSGLQLDTSYPIFFMPTATTGATNGYSYPYHLKIGVNLQTTVSGVTITANKQVFVEGTALDKNKFTVSSKVFVSEGAFTTNNYYIPIGGSAGSTTAINFNSIDSRVFRATSATNLIPVDTVSYSQTTSSGSNTYEIGKITINGTSTTLYGQDTVYVAPNSYNTSSVKEPSALGKLGTSANATQATVNSAINTKIGNLIDSTSTTKNGHTHGSITNNGTLNSDVTSNNMNKLVVTDGSNNIKTAICTYTNGKLNFGSG